MKRINFLTSLMMVAVLLFAKTSIAQSSNTWSSAAGLAVKSDTLYICADMDIIHPIELGYDIPGLRLHPSYGNWSLYAVSDFASPNDYSVSNVKNGGAGNAFKVVGSGIGGYIFEYKAKSDQCGLNIGESYLMYVFIIPTLNAPITADTLLCKQPTGSKLSTVINNYFPHTELYQKANIITSWNPTELTDMLTDSVGSTVYSADFTISGPVGALSCGSTGKFNYTVNVTNEGFTLAPITINICSADTVGTLGDRSPNVYFGRNVAGTYTPATIGNNWGAESKSFVFTYTDCLGNNKSVTDVLEITAGGAVKNWGRDTLLLCRTQVADVVELYSLSQGITPISLLPTSSTWADRGISGTLPLVYGPSGTSVFNSPSSVNTLDMGTNIGYNFLYRVDPSLCFGGDSGLFILMLQDPFSAVDFRTQLCTDYLGNDFDLASFTAIKNGTWSYVGAMATSVSTISDNKLTGSQLTTMGTGTHKLQYTVSAGCGGGGVGVMYIKIGGKVSIPASISEKYCKKTLPATINVNEVIGFSGLASGTANKWELTKVSNGNVDINGAALAAAQSYFDASTGIFEMSKATGDAVANLDLGAATSVAPLELTFNLTDATCSAGGGSSQLKIVIVDNIVVP